MAEKRSTKGGQSPAADLLRSYQEEYDQRTEDEMPFPDYIDACCQDSSLYATPHERLLKGVGKPNVIETHKDERLGRLFGNRTIRTYDSFSDFFGIEPTIEEIVSFFTRAAQGLHEVKKILYLLGPVGGGKSSIAERLKELMEREPIYVLKKGDEISPVLESPFALYSPTRQRRKLAEKIGIKDRQIPATMSPWAAKRLKEAEGDISQFTVMRLFPSILDEIAIAVVDAGDENNQDISTLVGKTDIRKLVDYPQDDADSYSFSGGLCRGNQGILEFREMFKAPIQTLNPLLFATQEGAFKGTEGLGSIPFNGIILAHSNESEWQKFRNDRTNEALVDRVSLIRVPYTLRVTEEAQIYEKMVRESNLADAPCAPETLRTLAKFTVLSRLQPPEGSNWRTKLRVYDGENMKAVDPDAKPLYEYQDEAGVTEGMSGISTRFGFEVLAKTFNFGGEVAANPVHLMLVLTNAVRQAQFNNEEEKRYLGEFIEEILMEDYEELLMKEVQAAYLETYAEYGQNVFDRYILWADYWCDEDRGDYHDPETGLQYDRSRLNDELEAIEKAAGIGNPKDFRNEIVRFALRYQSAHGGKNPDWRSYEKIKRVIEAKIFATEEVLLPVISFDKKKSEEEAEEHANFVARMKERGYTESQIRVLVDWLLQVRKRS